MDLAAPINRQMRAQNRTTMKPYEIAKLGEKPADRPDNSEAIRMCVNAWHQLDGDRHVGMAGAGAIPFTALVLWAEVNRLDRDMFDTLCHVISMLDNDRALAEQSKRALAKKGKKR